MEIVIDPRIWDGETLIAEARCADLDLDPPAPVSFDDAGEASRSYPGFDEHAYPTCFVCGPARDDGLGLARQTWISPQ